MKKTLCLATIGDVDSGALAIAFNNAIKLLVQDLHDRPALDKNRTLILKVDLSPVLDTNSHSPQFDGAEVDWQVLTKAPAIGSAGVMMKPRQDGTLFFDSEISEDPDQDGIDTEIRRRRRERGDPVDPEPTE